MNILRKTFNPLSEKIIKLLIIDWFFGSATSSFYFKIIVISKKIYTI